jgi:NAD(P)-dependent dehydrogenase (short-subunit alcohol dehydrogenase family)
MLLITDCIESFFYPAGRLAEPHEIGHVVDFLTSIDSGYITGTNIAVNGEPVY